MTIDWTKPIETLDGRPARVLATDLKGAYLILVAVPTQSGKSEDVFHFRAESCGASLSIDIRNVREKRRGFVVLDTTGLPASAHTVGYYLHQTHAVAAAERASGRVVVPLPEWEVPI